MNDAVDHAVSGTGKTVVGMGGIVSNLKKFLSLIVDILIFPDEMRVGVMRLDEANGWKDGS